MKEIPRYKCHKVVQALKITLVTPTGCNAHFIVPQEEGFEPIEVSSEWVRQHNPKPGGYYVVYEDGYTSYSPAQAFERGYTLITGETAVGTVTALQTLQEALAADDEFAWSWHCNIAMASVDEGMPHPDANRAAARFMQTCFGIDITKSKQWASLNLPPKGAD